MSALTYCPLYFQAPMFSWPRLRDADPLLKCEMASTGEVRRQHVFVVEFFFSFCFSLPFFRSTKRYNIITKKVSDVACESFSSRLFSVNESHFGSAAVSGKLPFHGLFPLKLSFFRSNGK